VLAFAAIAVRSVALAGFGLDSLIEVGASAVVIWELSGAGTHRRRRAMRLMGGAFAALALYLLVQSTWALNAGLHAQPSPTGIAWTAITAAVMFALAYGKARTGVPLGNSVLTSEGRVTPHRRPARGGGVWPACSSTRSPAGGGPTQPSASCSSTTRSRKPVPPRRLMVKTLASTPAPAHR